MKKVKVLLALALSASLVLGVPYIPGTMADDDYSTEYEDDYYEEDDYDEDYDDSDDGSYDDSDDGSYDDSDDGDYDDSDDGSYDDSDDGSYDDSDDGSYDDSDDGDYDDSEDDGSGDEDYEDYDDEDDGSYDDGDYDDSDDGSYDDRDYDDGDYDDGDYDDGDYDDGSYDDGNYDDSYDDSGDTGRSYDNEASEGVSSSGSASSADNSAASAATPAPSAESAAAAPESDAAAAAAGTAEKEPEKKDDSASEKPKEPAQKPPSGGTKKGDGIITLGEGMVKSALTGLPVPEEIGKRRPIACMIDNVEAAIPQSDISQADIYYECEVETDLSRICAVFEQYDNTKKIGPLRSCRDYFISLVAGLDPIYEHYGQAAYALPYLESDDVDNISGLLSYGVEDGFYRDGPHSAPHNAYTSGAGLDRLIDAAGYRKTHNDDFYVMYSFLSGDDASPVADGAEASRLELGYPYNKPYFLYDADTGLYSRFQNGSAHIDMENGEQLKVKNIILEYQNGTTYQDTIYLHYVTEGSGNGKYIANGKAIDITWSRDSFYGPVEYRTKDGEILKLEPGKTWVAVIRNDQLGSCKIGSSSEDMTCVASKKAVKKAKKKIEKWIADYKATEEVYLTAMAQMRTDNVAKHGGKTKVEVGLP